MTYYIAAMIGASGLIFAAWMVIFRNQDRGRILVLSLGLFALPIGFLVFDNYVFRLLWSAPFVVIILLEEVLKLVGSRLAKDGREAFALVLLFGLWEVVITKIIRVFFQDKSFHEFLSINHWEYSLVSLMPVLMHGTTAAIYSQFRARSWVIPFTLAFSVHAAFNYTRHLYFFMEDGQAQIRSSLLVVDVLFFGIAWLVLWKSQGWLGSGRRSGPQRM